MPPKPTPPLRYIIHAWDMHRPKSVFATSCPSVGILQRALDQALSVGATVITIRVVHRLPEPNRTASNPPPSTPREKWQEGHQP